MTLIENDSPKVQYTGPFIKGQLLPLTFPYIATEDVKMIIDDTPAIFNVDYEIITEPNDEHPVAYPNSAYIKNDLPNARQITLYRVTPLDQQAPFPQISKFRSERVEQALDKLTMQQQEQVEQLSRCIIAPITLETFNGQLPAPAADQALKWNTEGTALENYDIIGEQEAFETEVNTKFEEQSIAIENRIGQFEEETNTQFSEFRNEINENLEAVLNAADKLDTLDQQVQAATDAANTALTSATKADESAEEAFMAADQAEDTLEEIKQEAENALEEIKQVVQDAEVNFGTVTDALNSKVDLDGGNYAGSGLEAIVKKNSGGGLEIGDIGFTQMAIDETKGKRRILNGQLIIQDRYVQLTNIVKNSVALNPDLACTEEEWQTAITTSANGVCYKFVIDDEAGTIRLPKYPDYFVAGLTGTAPVVGNGNALGLSLNNGQTEYVGLSRSGASGDYGWLGYTTTSDHVTSPRPSTPIKAGTEIGTGFLNIGYGGHAVFGVSTKEGYSGLISNLSNDQTEQIKGTYFIQVATGAETEDNIINEIELNNPYSLGDSKYSPQPLNNLSWLKSEGQWNNKADYPSYYDWALINFNNGVEGFALSTGEYTDYDVVINTADETFRLPLLDGSESLISDRYDNLTLLASGSTYTAPANGFVSIKRETQVAITNETLDEMASWSTSTGSALFLPVRKKDVFRVSYHEGTGYYFRFYYAKGNGSLYYYVGETVQNANLINAGRIEEKIASLIPDSSSLISGYAMPSGKYVSLTAGADNSKYTAPANGWFAVAGNANGQGMVGLTAELMSTYCWVNTNNGVSAFIPVTKDMQVSLRVINATVIYLRFIYAEGEQ